MQKLTWFAETLHETAGAGRSSCFQLPSCSLFFLFLFFLFLFLTFYLSRLSRRFFLGSLSLSLLFSPLFCILWSSFLFLFSLDSVPLPTVSPSFFVAFPCQSHAPPSPLYSVFFVRVCSSLLFSPYYPFFLLLLRGLSLAFIKPVDAMRSPRQ